VLSNTGDACYGYSLASLATKVKRFAVFLDQNNTPDESPFLPLPSDYLSKFVYVDITPPRVNNYISALARRAMKLLLDRPLASPCWAFHFPDDTVHLNISRARAFCAVFGQKLHVKAKFRENFCGRKFVVVGAAADCDGYFA
jgi:hypothetical protein